MPNRHRARIAIPLAALLSLVLIGLTAPATLAYQGEVAANVTVTAPQGTITCGQGYDVSATVFDANGKKIEGQTVNWSEVIGPLGAGDTFAPPTGLSDANGVAHTMVTFNGPNGGRTVRAAADAAHGDAVITVVNCSGNPPPKVNVGDCQSAMGLDPASGFSDGTKVATMGQYLTFKLSFGAQYAGKLIIVTHAVRNLPPASPSWGSFFGATGRIADANGDVIYHFRSRVPAWISVRGFYAGDASVNPAITTACQGRWR